MDREWVLESHLLSRCYLSQEQIQELLATRYRLPTEAVDPYLVLTPTVNAEPTKAKETATQSTLGKNLQIKPSSTRRLRTRSEFKRYIKETLEKQKKLTKKVQAARRQGKTVDVHSLRRQYSIPRYDSYVKLHSLWKDYIHDVLFGDQKNPNIQMVLPKLSTADYNGCKVRVLESIDKNLIGMEGIVVHDSQHSFMVVVPAVKLSLQAISPAQQVGGLRVLAKKGTLFGFDVDVNETESVGFTILGSRFEIRAVDRSAKKFKSRAVEDIYLSR